MSVLPDNMMVDFDPRNLQEERSHDDNDEMMYLKLEDPSMFDEPVQPHDKEIFEDATLSHMLDEHFDNIRVDTSIVDDVNYQEIVDDKLLFGRNLPIDPDSKSENNIIDLTTLTEYVNLNENDLPYKITVNNLPDVTRVENQLKLNIKFNHPLINKHYIQLPTNTISRQKFYLKDSLTTKSEPSIDKILQVKTFLLVNDEYMMTSPKIVDVCMKCVQREQRRASRRKSGLSDNLLWCDNPRRSAILFNNKQILALKNDIEVSLTTRIVCYCRHHKANDGFKILLIVLDSNDTVLAKQITTPIIITDRKPSSINNSQSAIDLIASNDSVPTLSMQDTRTSSNQSLNTSNTVSPSIPLQQPKRFIPSPNSLSEGGSESFNSEYVSANYQDYSSSATTADFLPRQNSMNFNNLAFTPTQNPRKRSHLNIASTSNSTFLTDFTNDINTFNDPNQPILQRVIPGKGPTTGGIEVTLLGSNFKDGLKIRFGNNLALSTQCWNSSTMVTYLPPTQTPGQVLVTVTDPDDPINSNVQLFSNSYNNNIQSSVFTYTDETDRQLIELALQIVGLKMNGRLDDARNIAKKIVGNGDDSSNATEGQTSTMDGSQYNYNLDVTDEKLIIQVIKSMNKTTAHLSMCDPTGRTLLHLAALSGYYDLSLLLIKSGVRLDIEDSFAFTPLHFAAIGGELKVINMLLNCNANMKVKNDNHTTPKQLFMDNFDEKTHESFKEIIQLFDKHESKNNNLGDLSRISSHSSVDSSIFNEDLNDNAMKIESKGVFNNLYNDEYDEYDSSDSDASDCDFEDNISYSEGSDNDNNENDTDLTEDKYIEGVKDNTQSIETTAQVIERSINGEQTDETENNNPKRQSLWDRMLNHLNDDLPSYDDLFPRLNGKSNEDSKEIEVIRQGIESSQDTHNASSTSEDEEDDLLQRKLNRFFVNQKKTFQNDNMLLFFWIPLTLLLLTFVIFNSIYQGNESSFITKSTDLVKSYLIVGLGKIWLGNQRMKNYVTENLNNFPTTKKLNDLIVG
ncbi:similar to Saccharomyces cerevisiae YIR033W MGA2 ER membrane protein involved in regulation of OLE1 transcription, acts with homolog Spt23p [Maudiozyma saulgeensis]|uniref:Similar to Saccharomyces cerevisiae YIR033W MGA2 ER membrane protein involved in regulation of OLE1 transcription, acts with homolog Spt23p n=1 Tax=Maudiozyma saulgeensis TaxID=1789683 RepID=A0A1X7RAB2_9SACH|nr:similar to Saccharomyces cerevisiae YIR033W MGA2 ER membrane protein involved in regulation of OLE1 transcription, acts with homolog Spt23p [Kazachstania saulgeensis]